MPAVGVKEREVRFPQFCEGNVIYLSRSICKYRFKRKRRRVVSGL